MLLPSLRAICQWVDSGVREQAGTDQETVIGWGPQRKAHLGATTGGNHSGLQGKQEEEGDNLSGGCSQAWKSTPVCALQSACGSPRKENRWASSPGPFWPQEPEVSCGCQVKGLALYSELGPTPWSICAGGRSLM